jgi:hypothetical protein
MARLSPYPPELRECAVRMVAEVRPNYPTEWAAMKAVAAKLRVKTPETVPAALARSRSVAVVPERIAHDGATRA